MPLSKITITPKTRVGELLETFPELEPILIAMSPAFEKLKNPVLRKTVAKVATLQQVAVVGGINVDEMVKRLRNGAGQGDEESDFQNSEYLSVDPPDWFDKSKIVRWFDATSVINSGGSPMNEILHQANLLKTGEIFELKTPFIPAPIIDLLKGKSFNIHCIKDEKTVISFISK